MSDHIVNPDELSDDRYSIYVLQGVKRMLKRSDYFIGFVPPRNVMRDSASQEEACDAVQHAIDLLRERIETAEGQAEKSKYARKHPQEYPPVP